MPIDLFTEDRISLTALAGELDVSTSTCWRWTQRGIRGHRLECFSLGGRRYTTRQALSRFLTRINGGEAVDKKPPPSRKRQIAAAEKRAQQMGV
jgi:hypothetical protein